MSDNIEIQKINYLTKNTFVPITFNSSDFKNYSFNTFSVFESINNIFYLVFANNISIRIYNIIDNKKIGEINNAHDKLIKHLKYYLDSINKRDLIMSLSFYDNNIKIWDVNRLECLYNFKKEGGNFSITSCLIIENNQYYIAMGYFYYNSEKHFINVYDLKNNEIKKIKDSDDKIYYIDSYFDKKYLKNYIITGSEDLVKSFDYEENKLYHIYSNNTIFHNCIIINDKEKIIKLLESGQKYLNIFNFHTGEFLKEIKFIECINCFCVWKNHYLITGYMNHRTENCDKELKIVDLNEDTIIKSVSGHNGQITCIKNIFIPKFGECIISQGMAFDRINFWIIKEK